MERAIKERLTGAVIFVAVLAIAVPELLSGPGGDSPVRGDTATAAAPGPPLATYDLAIDRAAAPETSRQQEIAAPAPEAQSRVIAEAVPPPVTEPPRSAGPAREPEAASPSQAAADAPSQAPAAGEARAAPEPKSPVASAAPPAAATAAKQTGGWWVQLGSFSSADNAQRLARELRNKGFVIDVTKVRAGERELHRVRAGPEKDRNAAADLRTRLAAAGQQGTLVAP